MSTHSAAWAGASAVVLIGLLCACRAAAGPEEAAYSTGLWSRHFGNHRALVVVLQKAEAVRVHIPWRRRDADPEKKDIIVADASFRQRIKNVVLINVNREFCDLAFEPTIETGGYEVYYMPYAHSGPNHQFVTTYAPPAPSEADPAWVARNHLDPESLRTDAWKALPEANVAWIQARSAFDRMDPMEVTATAAETRELIEKHPDSPYLVFPEDRQFAIRMTEALPMRWIRNGPASQLTGSAARSEFYAFQLGVYAARQAVEDLKVEFSGIEGIVGPDAFRCINQGGTDCRGRPFSKTVSVPQGQVGALWCGVQVPEDAAPGQYSGKVTIRPKALPPTEITLALEVTRQTIADHGDADPSRQARIRWLDSTIGLDDEVVAPYTPLELKEHTVSCWNRALRFGASGMPESIRSGGREILDQPIQFYVETAEGRLGWDGGAVEVVKRAPGVIAWKATGQAKPLQWTCEAAMEFDGYVNFRCTVRADAALPLKDMGLEIPLRRDVAAYMMGLGRKGGTRPAKWQWTWDAGRANNMLWIGDPTAGLQCKLKDPEDTWNLYGFAQGRLPEAWANGAKGGCTVREESAGQVVVKAYTGERTIAAGQELTFCFGLLITPVKPLDPRHWSWRYEHRYVPMAELGASGANIVNVHQGNELNPYINYPFNNADLLGPYVRQAHKKNVKVKIYYTVRELSNHAAEIWALRSLGNEVFVDGGPRGAGGGGYSWLREHLIKDYAPAWHEPNLPNDDIDGAIATTGLSRWHNYYLEGLAWLLKNAEIDGLYLDGIGYDRAIMQRVRKVMERTRPGSLIDFHSGNNFEPQYGLNSPANQYMEHFPYIDSLWFGEGYDYNASPDYWLVEISGIPFGLFGEMLQGGGNPWRGMIFGMTNRLGWQGDPRPLWKLWDAFGIQEARMIGYWDEACPVKTGRNDVLATAYVKSDKALIALASWAAEPVQCALDIDWKAVGLSAADTHMVAPAIEGFQEAKEFAASDTIPVAPGRGWLLIVERR